MKLLLPFIAGVLGFAVWEVRGGPRWRGPLVVVTCAVVAVGFTSGRLI